MIEPTDKLEREVAAAFADVLRAQPGDEAKLASMIGAALKPPPLGGPGSPTAGAGGMVGPALVGGIGGVALTVILLSTRGGAPPPEVAVVVASPPPPVVVAPPPDREVFDEEVFDEEVFDEPLVATVAPRTGATGPIDSPTTQRPKRRAAVSVAPPADRLAPPEDADALLRAANQARRARSFTEADRLYTDLQARFPDSRAARTSRVPHGRVLLDTLDRPADALASFSAYLAADPRGTLAEEALVGRAQALVRMSREAEARDAWRTLFDRFPESVHAPVAQRHLAEAGP